MKATGIVRRIDDLGRVVIPKEIRRTMRIREGDPLEIYTSNDGEVIFKKYSAISEMGENAAQVADIMCKLAACPVVIFDRDHVVAVSGVSKKEFNERRVSPLLEELMERRKSYFVSETDKVNGFYPAEGVEKAAIACLPILSSGDVTGAVAFLEGEKASHATELQKSLISAAAMFLGKQIEG
ncbi:MAG: AbrB/MazE/SpoVT family DNA-binding domain-containing protein [Clostridium sp.]|nr:AbrB/MazE/SpoVT family DNA-binding domain-containing protein [Clostridium sp.]